MIEEAEPHQFEPRRHTVVQHWVSVGDVIVLIASVVTTVAGLAFTYGGLSRDVDALREQVSLLQQRDMTPGAAQAVAAMRAVDSAQDQAIEQIREDSVEFRREVRASLERIEAKLDNHDQRR